MLYFRRKKTAVGGALFTTRRPLLAPTEQRLLVVQMHVTCPGEWEADPPSWYAEGAALRVCKTSARQKADRSGGRSATILVLGDINLRTNFFRTKPGDHHPTERTYVAAEGGETSKKRCLTDICRQHVDRTVLAVEFSNGFSLNTSTNVQVTRSALINQSQCDPRASQLRPCAHIHS